MGCFALFLLMNGLLCGRWFGRIPTLLLLICLLAACATDNPTLTARITPAATTTPPPPTATVTPSPTAPPTATATSTNAPTLTPSATATRKPTATPTPSATPPQPGTWQPAPDTTDLPLISHISGGGVRDIAAIDRYLYTLIGREVAVFDFQSGSPVRVGSLLLPRFTRSIFLDLRTATGYVKYDGTGDDGSFRLAAIDITEPTQPRHMGELLVPGEFAMRQDATGVRLVAEGSEWWLDGLNITQEQPSVLIPTPLPTPTIVYPQIEASLLEGDHTAIKTLTVNNTLYILRSQFLGPRSVAAWDVVNREQPRFLGSYVDFIAAHLAYADGMLYAGVLGHAGGGFSRFDVRDPENPSFAEQLPIASNGFAGDGRTFFVGNRPGIQIYDVTQDRYTQIAEWQSVEYEAWKGYRTHLIYDAEQARVYSILGPDVGDGRNLEIIDVSNRTAPALLAELQTSDLVQDVTMLGDQIVLAMSRGLSIIDVSDPRAPVAVGYRPNSQYELRSVALARTADDRLIAYASLNTTPMTLQLIDITDPENPRDLTTLTGCDPIRGGTAPVIATETRLYWKGGNCGIHVYDIADADDPQPISVLSIAAGDMVAHDGILYVLSSGIFILQSP